MSIEVTYNGITIPYTFSTSFNQEPVYEDMGNTDWIGTKFDIKVQGYIHLDYAKSGHIGDAYNDYDYHLSNTDPLPESVYSLGPAAIIKSIRSRLLAPRRTLLFVVNGVDLIPKTFRNMGLPPRVVSAGNPDIIPDPENPGNDLNQNKQGIDSDNGPKPQSCNITRITDNMFHVDFHIIAIFYENRSGRNVNNVIGSNVLYNRWKEVLEIDECQYTKRTRTGRLKIRSDGTGVVPADVLTTMAVVGVPDGFVREGSQYTISPDGLTLDYTITDSEVFKLPPTAALKAKGTYTEILSRLAAIRHGELQLTLKSSKNIRQSDLVHRCIVIAFAKLNSSGLRVRCPAPVRPPTSRWREFLRATILPFSDAPPSPGAEGGIIESIMLRVDMYENEVTITMRVRLPPGPFTSPSTITWTPLSEPVPVGEDVRPPATLLPPLTPNWPRSSYNNLGTAMIPLMAAAYYDPSLPRLRVDEATGQLTNPDAIIPTDNVKVPGKAGDSPENFTF